MQRNNLLTALALMTLVTLTSTMTLAQSKDLRGWGARRALAGQGQVEKTTETTEPSEPPIQAALGGGILDTIEAAKEARRKALAGTWLISVPPLDGFRAFNAFHVFHQGGTFTEVSDFLGELNETPAKGVWDVEGDHYLLTFELFAFDEHKQPAGIVRVRCSIRLVNRDELAADTVVDFIAPDSTVELNIGGGPFTGRRIKVMDIR